MKKISCLWITFTLLVVSVFSSPFGDLAKTLNSFDTNPAEAAEGTFPEGKDVFPIIWKYVNDEPVLADKVQTTSMINYGVDKNWKKITDGTENQRKALEQNSKNVLQSFIDTASKLSDDDYKQWEEKAYCDIWVQQSVSSQAGNKLKAKKWYNAHPIEGKQVSIPCIFADIQESKNDKYAYMLGAVVGMENPILIHFYSNNDSYIDLKENQSMVISGTVSNVVYSDEYSLEYCIKVITIEE